MEEVGSRPWMRACTAGSVCRPARPFSPLGTNRTGPAAASSWCEPWSAAS